MLESNSKQTSRALAAAKLSFWPIINRCFISRVNYGNTIDSLRTGPPLRVQYTTMYATCPTLKV